MAEVAFRELYVAYAPLIKGMAMRKLGWPDGEDVVSEVFIVAMRRFDDMPQDPVARRAWLCTVANYKIVEAIRHKQRGRALQAKVETEWWRDEQVGLDPAETCAETEAARAAFASLSAADREIVNLVGVWGLSPQQAADALGCSVSAATTRLSRARSRLAAAFDAASTTTRSDRKEAARD